MEPQQIHPGVPADPAIAEQQGRYLSAEFLQSREPYWVSIRNRQVFVGCGDDRGPTEESAAALLMDTAHQQTIMDPREGYASIYGGVAGQAKNALVVGCAQFGPGFIEAVKGFDGVIDLLIQNSHIIQTLHSAEGNEQDPRHFSFSSDDSVGCAYAAGVGATADLLVGSSSAIRDVAHEEQQHVFGSDEHLDELLSGQQAFLEHATKGQYAIFAVDRPLYERYMTEYGNKLGIMILSGSHTSATTSGVISNFSLNQVGSASTAHKQNHDFYRLDIAIVTDTVLQALSKPLQTIDRDYILSPELLMRAFQLDSVPVRAVLASHDSDAALNGKLDPLTLKMGTRGDLFGTLNTLRERQTSGYYLQEA